MEGPKFRVTNKGGREVLTTWRMPIMVYNPVSVVHPLENASNGLYSSGVPSGFSPFS